MEKFIFTTRAIVALSLSYLYRPFIYNESIDSQAFFLPHALLGMLSIAFLHNGSMSGEAAHADPVPFSYTALDSKSIAQPIAIHPNLCDAIDKGNYPKTSSYIHELEKEISKFSEKELKEIATDEKPKADLRKRIDLNLLHGLGKDPPFSWDYFYILWPRWGKDIGITLIGCLLGHPISHLLGRLFESKIASIVQSFIFRFLHPFLLKKNPAGFHAPRPSSTASYLDYKELAMVWPCHPNAWLEGA